LAVQFLGPKVLSQNKSLRITSIISATLFLQCTGRITMLARLALIAALLLASSTTASPVSQGTDRLPIVDLGYEVHQALSYNDSFNFYTFSNIPFAQPPVGDLRFAAPKPPLRNEDRTPKNGSGLRICPQATAGYGDITLNFYLNYTVLQAGVLTGRVNASVAGALLDNIPLANDGVTPPFPAALYQPEVGESEDCLYLDVLVPRNVLEGRRKAKAPVLGEFRLNAPQYSSLTWSSRNLRWCIRRWGQSQRGLSGRSRISRRIDPSQQ
jgi:hypothetical protein